MDAASAMHEPNWNLILFSDRGKLHFFAANKSLNRMTVTIAYVKLFSVFLLRMASLLLP